MHDKDLEELEGLVISNLCRSAEVREAYLEQLSAADFTSTNYDKIFDAIIRLVQNGTSVNKMTLAAVFPGDALMRTMIAFCFDNGLGELTLDQFKRFKQEAGRKRLAGVASYLQRKLKQGASDLGPLIEEARRQLELVDGDSSMIEVVDHDTAVDSTIALIDEWSRGGIPYRTHIPEIDERMFLSQLTGYNVLAGESGAGKTAFMMLLAKENARAGKKSVIFSLEMRKELLILRMAMDNERLSGIEFTEKAMQDPTLVSSLKYATEKIRDLPITIVDNVFNIFRIGRIARKLSTAGYGLMFLDYLQLADTMPADADVVRVSRVSSELKKLTVGDPVKGHSSLAVVALSQYAETASSSATATFNKGGGPSIKALRWSRQIRMDADFIGHLLPTSDPDNPVVDVNFFCEKQRNFKDGWTVPLQFVKGRQTFTSPRLLRAQRRGVEVALETVPF